MHQKLLKGVPLSKILDVFHDLEHKEKVTISGKIGLDCFNYFFRKVLPCHWGARQAMISLMFQRLHEACVLNGIAPVWDEENEDRVNEVLQRLNFNVQRTAASKKKGVTNE